MVNERSKFGMILFGLALVSLFGRHVMAAGEETEARISPWYFSVSPGYINFEGDEIAKDTGQLLLGLGYDQNERWSWEGILTVIPELEETFRNSYGEVYSRMEDAGGPGVNETWALGLAVEALWHLAPQRRFDPYLAGGIGGLWFADDVGKTVEAQLRLGLGALYHLTDSWALRADGRAALTSENKEFNLLLSAGLVWRPAAKPVAATTAAAIPAAVEPVPPPEPPDTDGDGLTDVDETKTHKTDPHNPDTDYDGLSDGEEIDIHKTDPRKRDTDGGGVADGHEVLEDVTSPLEARDDLKVFELQIQFDPGKWEIKPEYYSELGVVGKLMKQSPEDTARIEGHSNHAASQSERESLRLTEKRAKAVRDYLKEHWGIPRGQMKAVGYGVTRPKAKPDTVKGNPANHRIEVYIRDEK